MGLGLAYQKRRLGPKLAVAWARGASEKNWDPLFISETVEAIATGKLVHNMSSGLPCQTQVLGPNQVGSELGEYHSPPHYDDDATVYSTCHQKLAGTQISLLSGIKQKN